jgi:hypothetical protein
MPTATIQSSATATWSRAREAGMAMAERIAWRICSDNQWWSAFGKKRGKNGKAGRLLLLVAPMTYDEPINHYSVLSTIDRIYGLPTTGLAATTPPIADIWTTNP